MSALEAIVIVCATIYIVLIIFLIRNTSKPHVPSWGLLLWEEDETTEIKDDLDLELEKILNPCRECRGTLDHKMDCSQRSTR